MFGLRSDGDSRLIDLLLISLASLLGLASLLYALSALRHTTLVSGCVWAILALIALTGSRLLIGRTTPTAAWSEALHYAAATLTLCPAMAVFGAKRPQNKAWQMIVLSLWIVLILPAAQTVVLNPGDPLQLHWMWSLLLAILILSALMNYLFTRFWLPAAIFCLGQWLLLAPYLPGPAIDVRSGALTGGVLAVGLAAPIALLCGTRRRARDKGLDRLWLDFRNHFGTVWGLRVAERVNASAVLLGWPVRLQWHGFQWLQPALPEQQAEIERSLRTILRRFVSREWIDQRLRSS